MGKVNGLRQDRMETDDYRFGWESAERGEPYPDWRVNTSKDLTRIENQRMGWQDYRDQEASNG